MIIKLDGKALSEKIYKRLENEVNFIKNKDKNINLVVIQVGNNQASNVYVKNKRKASERLGIGFQCYNLVEDLRFDEAVEFIKSINNQPFTTGIIVQKPLPEHLEGIEQYVSPEKDVDGFTFENMGRLITGYESLIPCTTKGIMNLFKEYDIDLKGKHIVVIGRSNIVGKPTAISTLAKDATVTICHSKTKNLQSITAEADILISAIGKANFIDSNYLTSKCQCIIDVGINRNEEGKLCGDCNYNDIIDYWERLSDAGYYEDRYITPVPRRSWSFNRSKLNGKYYKSGIKNL